VPSVPKETPGDDSKKEKEGNDLEKENTSEGGESGGEDTFPHGDPTRIDIMTLEPGNGVKAGPNGSVEIEYTGFLANGKEFIRHKEVIELGQRKNIKGLEQACTQISEGARIKLWIPFKLAYGTKGGGDLIPPNADLTFELFLLKVHRP